MPQHWLRQAVAAPSRPPLSAVLAGLRGLHGLHPHPERRRQRQEADLRLQSLRGRRGVWIHSFLPFFSAFFFFFLVELAARETKCGCAVLGDAKHQPAVLPAGCRGSPCAFGVGKGASYRRMEAAGGKKMQKGRVLSLLLQSGFSQGCSGPPCWLQPEG